MGVGADLFVGPARGDEQGPEVRPKALMLTSGMSTQQPSLPLRVEAEVRAACGQLHLPCAKPSLGSAQKCRPAPHGVQAAHGVASCHHDGHEAMVRLSLLLRAGVRTRQGSAFPTEFWGLCGAGTG